MKQRRGGWLHGRGRAGPRGMCMRVVAGGPCRWKAECEQSYGGGTWPWELSSSGWLAGGWDCGTWGWGEKLGRHIGIGLRWDLGWGLGRPSSSSPQCLESLCSSPSAMPSHPASPSLGTCECWHLPLSPRLDCKLFLGSVNHHVAEHLQHLALWHMHLKCTPNLLNKWLFTKWKFHFYLTRHECCH